jgi:hypothetical protein
LPYAVLSNHIHLILRNRPDVVAQWSDEEVAIRWLRVFPGKRLEEHLAEPTDNDVLMLVNNATRLAQARQRLSDISWFMRALAEPIARLANRQDNARAIGAIGIGAIGATGIGAIGAQSVPGRNRCHPPNIQRGAIGAIGCLKFCQ